MRHKPDIAQLRKILAIRALQRDAAEADAARASTTLTEKAGAQRDAQASQTATEQRWQDLHAEGAMPLELMDLWAMQVRRELDLVRKAAAEVTDATTARDSCADAFRAMEQRKDWAGDAVRTAVRDREQVREEAALQAAADRHLHKRDTP
jgi:hypothetical protein